MKRTIAVLLTLGLLGAFAACGEEEPGKATAESTTQPATLAGTTTSIEASTETSAEVAGESTTGAVDPLQLFNEATRLVKELRPGYEKSRYTNITDLDFGLLGQFQIVKDEVYGFMDVGSNGVGTLNTTVAKGQASDQLRASKWTAADIKRASAEPDGRGGWVVTLLVKDGGSSWSGAGGGDPGSGSLNNPIDRGPLCYGEDDESKYDHKTAKNLYVTINGADNASTKGIREDTYDIKVEANIDAQGRLQRLYGYMGMTAWVDSVKYLFVTLRNKSGSGYGEVVYENFRY